MVKLKRTARGLGKRNDVKKRTFVWQKAKKLISWALNKGDRSMAVVKCKPTSAGRRHVVKVVNTDLHKGAPYAPLLDKKASLVAVTTTDAPLRVT